MKCHPAVNKRQQLKTIEDTANIRKSTINMLKSVFCRFNSIPSRDFVRVSRNVSAIVYRSNKKNGQSNNKSKEDGYGHGHVMAVASIPTFLLFFQKKPDESEPGPSFWEKILPEDIVVLLKARIGEDESTPEKKLTVALKRTILAIHKQQYEKAEQMAHLALRMAQDIQHYDGITLCYDVMGNLAFDREQYAKAEKLFESVLQRLIQKGVPQDDIQVLHLSLKVAQLVDLQGKKDEAKTNYAWTMRKLDEKCAKEPENQDLLELNGLTNNYYAKFLSKQGNAKEALQRMKTAQEIFSKIHGTYEREYVDIVNNLAVLSLELKDYDSAHAYINEAIVLASVYPELMESGVYHANKGLICLQKSLFDDAKQYCLHALKASKRSNHSEGKEQAKHCMDEYEKFMKIKVDLF